ncbi:Hypothetical predicted protein [Mytilus galloprovincialis]|uniref:Uncharacterized protein n=1 Tax=Mytilus galloprovincialis TaxID=29158 RepID=A0A8B6GUQ9_MYTGA|nr:Hypothetical predicted protein [Mytilus galloprovincialis]
MSSHKTASDDYRWNWDHVAEVDCTIFYLMLKFLVNREVKKDKLSKDALYDIQKIEDCLFESDVIHRDVAYNLLAWCYCSVGWTCEALYVLRQSWFDFDDPEFNNLLGNIATLFKYAAAFRLENCFPILDKVNPFNKTKLAVEGRREIQKYIATRIESVRCSFDANNIRHFLDVYLEQEEKPDSKISDETLFITIADLYIAGTDTTSVTLQWSMLYMIKYPDVQKKCRNQILEVIGEDRQPVVKDKDNIPYVMATLQEVQRISTIAPLSVPHVAIEDVEIDGKIIPRDTIIIPHLMSVHLDPTVWDKPEEFRPERFLDKDGHFVKKEGFSAFSMGPRLCPGKQLAESELLLFFVSIIQRFNLTKGDDNDQLPMTGIQTGTTNQPHPFKICFIPR